jgi:hypothetical protein
MRTLSRALPVGLVAMLLSSAVPAHAQDNAATVEALFDAGKKLVAAGNFAAACPKFLSSYTLDPRIGTLLNLADCYEKNGQAASAWARFVEATTLASRAGQADRAAFAAAHAKELRPKLSTLVVAVPGAVAGETVTRDGIAVDAGAYGVAVPVDGGKHVLAATAPGKKTWTGDITLQATGDTQTLTVPALEAAPVVLVAEGPTTTPAAHEHASPTRMYLGVGTAAVGVALAGVGAVFGVMALGKNHDASADCGKNGVADDCTAPGVALRSTAVTDGTVSTVLIGVGAAAVVGGVVLWLTAPSSHSSTTVGFDGRSVVLSGKF